MNFRKGRITLLSWSVGLFAIVSPWQSACPQSSLVRGNPSDWSHRHVIATGDRAIQGSALALKNHRLAYAWLIRTYRSQLLRSSEATNQSDSTFSSLPLRLQPPIQKPATPFIEPTSFQDVDWQVSLGAPMADATFPAKYGFNLPGEVPTCADFIVYGLNVAGTTNGQPNLIGLQNLYSGTAGGTGLCGSGSATVKFAYNGSTMKGAITNSVTLSEAGDKVAYVESTSGASVLHVVAIPSGTGKGTVASAVAAPGIKTVPSTGTWAADTHSSVWVDYGNDFAYVGTDDGTLHKIQNVFCTTPSCVASPVDPTEVTASPWPLVLSGAGPLTSPVQDGNGTIYLAGASNGNLYAINSSTGAFPTPTQSFMPNSIVDAPLLDIDSSGNTQALYWFSNSQSAAKNPSVRQPQLVQTNAGLTTFNNYPLLLNRAAVGTSEWQSLAVTLYSGTFDNAFYANRSGSLWTCAWWQPTTNPGDNYLVMARFNLSGTSVTPDNTAYTKTSEEWASTTGYGAWQYNTCSPMTEALDSTGADRIFVGSKVTPATVQCKDWGSCMYGFSTSTTTPLTLSASYSLGYGVVSPYTSIQSISGIVIDNTASPTSSTCGTGTQTCAQTSSIYFTSGTSAIKLTQAAFQ